MEDHCHSSQNKGISTAYLGSAQPDKGLEDRFFLESSPENVFVTPEWLSSLERKSRVRALAKRNLLTLIAVDEAHLIWETGKTSYQHSKIYKT